MVIGINDFILQADSSTNRNLSHLFWGDQHVSITPVDINRITFPKYSFLRPWVFVIFSAYSDFTASIASTVGIFDDEIILSLFHLRYVKGQYIVDERHVGNFLLTNENFLNFFIKFASNILSLSNGEPTRLVIISHLGITFNWKDCQLAETIGRESFCGGSNYLHQVISSQERHVNLRTFIHQLVIKVP